MKEILEIINAHNRILEKVLNAQDHTSQVGEMVPVVQPKDLNFKEFKKQNKAKEDTKVGDLLNARQEKVKKIRKEKGLGPNDPVHLGEVEI